MARLIFDLLPSASRYPPASELKALLAPSVMLKRGVGVMEATAVGFDDEARVPPHKVRHQSHTAGVQSNVDLWGGKSSSLAHAQK
jgi:hypothetical protein